MPLPKISTPTYELELPSTGKKIRYRPFLVREEKILIMALESEDTKQISSAIVQILSDCIATKTVKVSELSTFDIEYLFLNVRAKSVGETVEVNVTCPDDGETQVQMEINIDDIKVQKNPDHSKQIKVDNTLAIEMKYPSLDQFIKSNFDFTNDNNMEQSFDLVASCVQKIYTEEEIWTSADVTKKEIVDFLEQMNSSQFKNIEKFFETMPKLSHEIKVKNPNTKVESTVILEGLSSFFV